MKLLRPNLILPSVKTKLMGWAAAIFVWLACSGMTGCHCPWKGSNAQLNESSRWLQSGIEAFHDGKTTQAEKLLSQAIRSRPGDPVLKEHLADVYLEQGKTEQAIEQLIWAAESSGESAELLVRIGNLYLANGQALLAEQYSRKALQTDRQNANAWVLKADIELSKGQLNEALKDYQRAIGLEPESLAVMLKVAEVHRLSGRPMRAYSTIENMLSGIPEHQQPSEALLSAGRLLLELKQPTQAIAKLAVAANRSDASPDSFIQLANAKIVLGQNVDAHSILARGKNRFPQHRRISEKMLQLESSNDRIAVLEPAEKQLIR